MSSLFTILITDYVCVRFSILSHIQMKKCVQEFIYLVSLALLRPLSATPPYLVKEFFFENFKLFTRSTCVFITGSYVSRCDYICVRFDTLLMSATSAFGRIFHQFAVDSLICVRNIQSQKKANERKSWR